MTVSRRIAGSPLRYALAPTCVGVAVVLHVTDAGAFLHPTGLFILAVVASVWLGGTAAYWRVGSALLERERAERALRESEERYERAMAAAEAGHYDWNPATDTYYASPRLLGMAGIPAGTRISTWTDFQRHARFHAEDLAKWQQAMKALFRGDGSRLSGELRLFVGEETRWYRIDGMCFRDAAGKVMRWTGSSIDVTARKLAEEALRRSEQRYALAMEAAGDGHTDWDLITGEFYISPRLLGILGYAPGATFSGRADWVQRFPFHPEDRRRWETAVAAHFSGREAKFRMDLRIVVGGKTRWVAFTFIATRDVTGKPVRWTGSIADINDAKLAEEALRESEMRYERVVAATEAGFWDWDIVQDKYYVSPRLLEMSRLPPGTIIRRRAEFQRLVPLHPEDLEKWQRSIQELFASGGSRLSTDLRVDFGAETRWYRLDGMCFRDPAGKVVRWTGSAIDVTSRKLAEEALQRSEQGYELAMEAAQDAHWDWNMVTGEYYLSPRNAQLYGFPAGTKVSTREEALALLPYLPEENEAWARATSELFAGSGERLSMEQRAIVREEIRWFKRTGVCVRDRAGRPIRWSGSVRDVTDRRRTEAALRLSEERYALAMEVAEEGHFDWNVQTDQMFASAHALRVMNVPEDLEYRTRGDIMAHVRYHPKDWPRISEAWRAALAGRGLEHEFEYLILRGEEPRTIRGRWKIFRDADGVAQRVIGVVSDVTERKRVDEALRQSEERYSLALEASEEGHYDINPAADSLFLSDRMYEIFGYPPGTRFTKRSDFVKQFPFYGNDGEAYWAAVDQVMAKDGPDRYELEYRIVRPSGEMRWLSTRAKITRDADGNAMRRTGTQRDITEVKLAAESLRKMEQELRHAQRLEALGTLSGGIAHDFNNILGAILGYGEMALRDAPEGSRLARDLDSIMVAGERGRALVDRVLAFSRSGVGERVPVHVENVAREALDLVSAKLPPDVTLHAKLHAGRAAMLGDATQVHQVVVNLATNAIHAMAAGGTLRISLGTAQLESARRPTIGVLDSGEYLVLEVADSGTGIPSDILDRIFDPFFTTKEVGTGTGLGLSLVHGIVTSVGGAIDVVTKIGKGSTFTVYLPRCGDAPATAADENQPLPRGQGQRVLVVDDEEPLVRLATETLAGLGYAPTGFTSSTAALAAFRADPGRFDALLTDERMPGLSGSALIRHVRGIRVGIPVILMSGYFRLESVDADVIVKKPLSARDLAASMARALSP